MKTIQVTITSDGPLSIAIRFKSGENQQDNQTSSNTPVSFNVDEGSEFSLDLIITGSPGVKYKLKLETVSSSNCNTDKEYVCEGTDLLDCHGIV